MKFDEVKAEDFTTFSRQQPTHVKIEQALIELGGKGVKGAEYKKTALNAAGWNYGALISYGAHPEKASEVFNTIRQAMADNESADADQLIEAIKPSEN